MTGFLEIIFSLIIFIRIISSSETPGLGGRPWAAGGAPEGGGRGATGAGRGYAESP
jgi:hypothetical protein